ncbi:hypothetical protein ACLKA6_013975 [Drosophila palustris]
MSSSHSGTIGRKRVGSGSAVGSDFYYGSGGSTGGGSTGGGGEQLRRQRSAEWHSHRHGHGYGSSSEDEYQNTAQATAFDTQLLAQLLLQSQQLASMEHYNSDCEPEYLRQRDRRSEDSSLEVTYAQPHPRSSARDATAAAALSPLKLATLSASTAAGKYQSNANLGLFPNSSSSSSTLTAAATATRSTNPFLNAKYAADETQLEAAAATATPSSTYLLPASASSSTAASSGQRSQRSGAARNTLNRLSGMTSSSSGASALSVNRSDSLREKAQHLVAAAAAAATSTATATATKSAALHCVGSDLDDFAGSSGESEPPPEPAPPEIPPRTQSLLMSLRKHSDYKLKYEEKGDQKHEEFIPTSQLQKDYIISDNLRTVEQQLRPISPGDSQGRCFRYPKKPQRPKLQNGCHATAECPRQLLSSPSPSLSLLPFISFKRCP